MGETALSHIFEKQSPPPPVIKGQAYYDLLSSLLDEGQGYGKTEPIAAYLLRNLRLVDSNTDTENDIEIKPVYLVMDLAEYPNEYARSLILQEIWTKYVENILAEEKVNSPDFKGAGLWTVKQSSFEEDYMRRETLDGKGKRVPIYDPDPEAFRLCLSVENRMTIPVQWGTYTVKKGGTLAVRAKDVQALAAALKEIDKGHDSIDNALFTTNNQGNKVAKFDVYAMEPDFLENNYKTVALSTEVSKTLIQFRNNESAAQQPAKHKASARTRPLKK